MAELFYSVSPELHRFARLEGGEIVELDFEILGRPSSLLGGIYYGRVVDVQKPLRAAFVDIGEEKLGILPLYEGKLPPIKQGDAVLIQVIRTENPLEGKGVRLTRLLSLSLGPLLYTPFVKGLSLSKKIKDKDLLKKLFDLRPEEGLIVRRWATLEDSFESELAQLREEWEHIQSRLSAKPPFCISLGPDLLNRTLRSLSASDILTTDNRHLAFKTQGKSIFICESAFDERCEEAWESLLSPEIYLSQGGNLFIEETRCLTVIDVNSQGALRHRETFNKKAVREALRQIRLRELGGKIVIDLIDSPKEIGALLQGLTIPSDLEIWGLSSLGLLEMTRRRKRLSLPLRLKLHLN
ncbi:MAG: ribonuclease E/G [Alphaproteobacteria bacterium]|nr:ribonuclease E/G [Alphaproteobacteria bacterium]